VVVLLIYREKQESHTSRPAPREMENANERTEHAQPKKTIKLSVQAEKTMENCLFVRRLLLRAL
jgi:hypothetical protein